MKNTLKLFILGVCVGIVAYFIYSVIKTPALDHKPAVDNIPSSLSTPATPIISAEPLVTKYIHSVEWPPKAEIMNRVLSCEESEFTSKHIIGNKTYCVTQESEGAAGSTYTTYNYSFLHPKYTNKTVTLTFTLRSVQCENYDDPEKNKCEAERKAFDVNKFVIEMIEKSSF